MSAMFNSSLNPYENLNNNENSIYGPANNNSNNQLLNTVNANYFNSTASEN